RHFLVLFDDVTSQWTPGPQDGPPRKGKAIAPTLQAQRETKRLKEEVAGARDALRSAIESEDALKEEFQSANEEILSANEELQSTNEELETSKEELQSANEELNTLNAELRNKNSDLHDLNNDISNFLNSTRIPVVMLDRDLRIRRLTPTADKLLKVQPSDIGRPLADMRPNIEAPELERSIAKVLESLQPEEREVRDLQGHWHSLTILPYRTQDNKIDGVVLSLQDIDAIKTASEQARKSSEFFHGIMETVRVPLLVLDPDLKIIAANESFQSTFKVSAENTVNKFIYDLGNGQWNIPKLRELLEHVLPKVRIVTDFEVEHDFESIGRRNMLLNARTLVPTNDRQPMVLLAIEDITERSRAEATLRESEERFRALFELGPVAVYYCDAAGVIQNFNRRAAELWGRTPVPGDTDERFCGSFKMFRPDGSFMPHELCPMAEVIAGKISEAHDQEVLIQRPDGSRITVVVNIRPLKGLRGEVTGGVNCFYDITERKQAEAALIKSEKLAAAGRLAATLAHEINNPLQAVTNLVELLRGSPKIAVEDRAYADMAAEELGRVTHLTRQSLSFYRETTSPIAIDMEEMLREILNLYAKRIKGKRLAVNSRYASGGARIESYPGAVRQVLSTVLVNALEAAHDDGTIAIRVRKSSHGKNLGVRGVRIAVADTGGGISPANLSRIFEPFFTTKGDHGTGLGLWVARGIMDGLDGTIRMRSSTHPGKSGTCFLVFFPNRMPTTV
ncbi:MAG: PAS domain-containing protein, partial [Acidobacteriaceae bacterium]